MNLFVQYRSYLCQLAIFAAFALLATTVAAQTYTVTDLGALGRKAAAVIVMVSALTPADRWRENRVPRRT